MTEAPLAVWRGGGVKAGLERVTLSTWACVQTPTCPWGSPPLTPQRPGRLRVALALQH